MSQPVPRYEIRESTSLFRRRVRTYVVLIGENSKVLSTTEVFERDTSAGTNIAAQRKAAPVAPVYRNGRPV